MERNVDLESWLRRHGVEDTFRGLAELLPGVAVVVTDASRGVLYWSPEAERLFGRSARGVTGRSCPDGVVCDGDVPRPFGAAARIARADGTWVHVRHYTRAFANPDGSPAGAIHVMSLDAGTPSEVPPLAPDPEATDFHGLLTRDPALLRVIDVIRNVAETDATVLVRGESGTGKELVAKAIHLEGRRRDGPFVAVNCAAFTPTLLESELFGHTKGAFTGATTARKGIFALADGGTLFLDEVAELPLDLQAKLLRVLQERTFVPLGGTEPQHTDVRVIAATHRALRDEVRAGRFREDLMFRLRVVPIFLPALRERRADVDLLIRHFVAAFNLRGPRLVTAVAPDAKRALLDYPWPGNVRELRNVVEYAFAVGRGPVIGLDELPPEFREARRGVSSEPPLAATPPQADRPRKAAAEEARVREALERADGDIDRAAELLGVSRTTFWRLRKRAGLL